MGLYLPVKQLEEDIGGPRGLPAIFMSGQVDIMVTDEESHNLKQLISPAHFTTNVRSNLNEIFKLMGVSNLRKHF